MTTSVVILLGAAAVILFAAVVAIVGVLVFAVGEGDPVADVQQYLALTEAAHRLIPPGPVLIDPRGGTSAGIDRFLARKEEARHALWASRRRPREESRSYRGVSSTWLRQSDIRSGGGSNDRNVEPGTPLRRG